MEAVGERIPRSQSEGSDGPPPAEEAAEGLAAGLAGGLGTPQRTGSMPAKVVWSGPPRHASRPRLPTKDREVEELKEQLKELRQLPEWDAGVQKKRNLPSGLVFSNPTSIL